MTKTKVLLHLGLPKTATSSLQHNVFQKIHENGDINFLGKCLTYDLITKSLDVKNYTGRFIRDGAEGRISIEETREKLCGILEKEKLNVFSDEGLMVAYPGKENVTLGVKLRNLSEIFRGYNLQVVVTLRDPVDYLYSLYAELYPDYFSNVRDLDSIKKYIDRMLSNEDDVLFESFFYMKWLTVLEKEFSVTVLSYEKLVGGDKKTYSIWASLLGIDESDFSEYFGEKKINVKKKVGNEVGKVRDLKRIEIKVRAVTAQVKPVYVMGRWFYNFSGLKKLFNYRVVSKKTHQYPSGAQLDELRTILSSSAQRNESL